MLLTELAISDKSFCVEFVNDEKILKKDHAYFYQVQLQMKVCEVEYADFVIWRESELVVLRIEKDSAFL